MRRHLSLIFLAVVLPLGASGAWAANNPFTVSGIKVDATAASASEAFRTAVDNGRRAAWDALIHRLTRETDWDRVPVVDTDTLRKMLSGYQVSNEKRSTTRYTADVTYTFNGDMVRRFLRNANIAYAASAAPPLLVVPLAPSYSRTSDWTAAWAANRMAAGAVPLQVPIGDALDMTILGPITFDTGAWSDLQPVASRVHASQAALVRAGPVSAGHMTVSIRILSPAGVQTLTPVQVSAASDTPRQQVYAEAVRAAGAAIGEAWKVRSAIDFNESSTLTVEVRLNSLAQWGAIQQKLATVPVVTHVNVAALSIGEAQLVLSYAGTPEQLQDFLSQAALALTSRDGVWWLSAQSADGGVVDQ